MSRARLLGWGLLSALVSASAAARAAEVPAEVDRFFKSYIEAFAAADAAKLAALWTEDAEWTNGVTGEHTTGRDAVQADFAAFFADNPGARLTGEIERAKEVSPGVVCLEGQAVVTTASGDPVASAFSAVLVSRDDKWMLASVRESAPAVPETPYERLKALDFLIGDWRDQGGEADVQTSFRWAADGAFLVRTYTVTVDDAVTRGTQVIGWDPRESRLRSWNFVSDGSFGEGAWSKNGDEWVGRLSQTLADGGVASALQVIRRVDDETLEIETVGREIDGEPQPSAPPVRVTRVAAGDENAQATADAAATQGGQQ